MIRIEERRCEKLSGYTSLFLSFDYDDVIVSWIKSNLDCYNYNKKTYEWEIPDTCLNQLCDSLNSYDDITISLFNDIKPLGEKRKLRDNYKLKPYKHQEEAIQYGLQHNKWLLLDAPGLGKSSSIIHIAEELKLHENLEHCLIICGINTLKANWKKEIKLHSDETFRVLGEKISKSGKISYLSVKDRVDELLNPIDEFFIIVNIETLRSNDFIEAFKKSKNKIDMIVIDEVHKCSNKSSQQGANILKLDAKYKIAATGTLLTNSAINSYLPLKWIDVDKANLTTFKKEYCQFGGFGGHEIIGYQNLDILKDEIDRYSLRRTKDILSDNLPPKTIINELVTMSDEHRKFYQEVKKGVSEECDKIELNANNVLALVTRLRQATACPSMLTSNNIRSSKIDRAVEIVDELIGNGEKVVVFSTYKESVKYLQEYLAEYNPLICTGDIPDDIISSNIDKFQQDSKYKLLIATHQKLGTGVTLNAASYMVFIDSPFTAAAFTQACDRIYRIGTKRPVFIYNLICEDTIDERVAKIVTTKQALSDYMIDNMIDSKTISILKDYILDL